MNLARQPLSALFAVALAVTVVMAAVPALADDLFAIGFGDTISDGSPGPGAGNIASGGEADVYTFAAVAGDEAILDVLAGGAGAFRWTVVTPGGVTLIDQGLFTDRHLPLTETGSYSVTVTGATPTTTGTYSFRLLAVPEPQEFAIDFGVTVADGSPGPGAGNIEVPGASDIYTFDAAAGQGAVFDILAGTNVFIHWRLLAADGSTVFDSFIGDRNVTLPATGTYTLVLSGNGLDDTGTYSFRIESSAAVETFGIAVGDTVSDGVPEAGAGNLEGPGAVDRYELTWLVARSWSSTCWRGRPTTSSGRWWLPTVPRCSTRCSSTGRRRSAKPVPTRWRSEA